MALDDRRHPDAEQLAEYADGVLAAEARAEVERHLADCAECRAVVTETMAFLEQNPAIGEGASPAKVVAFPVRRRWIGVAAGLAAAAAIVLVARLQPDLWQRLRGGRAGDPHFAGLVAAVGDERTIEARLTGGFRYGSLKSATRSGDSLTNQNLQLLAAAGDLQKAAQASPTAENLHAWGVAQLLLGRYDESVRQLEDAAAERPRDASIRADLAAAYLARAKALDRADDWSHALDAAERAVREDGSLLEPLFTRALAAEHLKLDAAQAWRAYLEKDPSSPWAVEARAHLSAIDQAPARGDRGAIDRDLIDAVTRSDAAAQARAAVRDPQRTREYLEENLTAEWGTAVLAGNARDASRALASAESLAGAYRRNATDDLPIELVRHLRASRSVSAERALASAVADYAKAAAMVREDRLNDAEPIVARVRPALAAAGSPLRYWADYLAVLSLSQRGQLAESLSRLSQIESVCAGHSYPALCGTVLNRIGQIHGRQGDQERAVSERLQAIRYFERAKDEDQIAVMHSQIAESYRLLSEPRLAWTHHLEALRRLADTHNFRSRHLVLVQAGMTSTFERSHDSALWFQHAVVENGKQWRRASAISTGLLHLARNYARLGRADEALSEVREARIVGQQMPDPEVRERQELEVLEVEGEVFGSRDPREGIPVLDRAIDRFDATGFGLRLAALRLARGLLYERAGDRTAAERDWSKGIERLETERRTLTEEQLRMSQAGSLRDTWSAITVSRLKAGAPPAASLDALEQSHARTLVEHALSSRAPLAIAEIQRRLPADTALLYFLIHDQIAVGWLLTSASVVSRPLGADGPSIATLARRYRRVVDTLAGDDVFLQVSTQMYGLLLAPFGADLRGVTSLVVVPDPVISGISFAALRDPATRRFLIADHAVAMAPSGSLLVEAAAPRRRHGTALMVSASAASGFAPLPWADEEARTVASLHPDSVVLSGAATTKRRVLEALPDARVVHFAGHAVSNAANPLLSRLVLNASAEGASDLYAYELLQTRDLSASLVVLAACRSGYSAGAATDDDGVLALARPFLARGAQTVLASLWDVADRHSVPLMTRLHRHLQNRPAPAAWRDAVLDSVTAGEPILAGWAAYALFLGRDGLSARPLAAERSTTGETR